MVCSRIVELQLQGMKRMFFLVIYFDETYHVIALSSVVALSDLVKISQEK